MAKSSKQAKTKTPAKKSEKTSKLKSQKTTKEWGIPIEDISPAAYHDDKPLGPGDDPSITQGGK